VPRHPTLGRAAAQSGRTLVRAVAPATQQTMTSQGTSRRRFQRALQRGQLFHAELAARELRELNLPDALARAALIAGDDPVRYSRAAVRWHGRFAVESKALELPESQLALVALAALPADPDTAWTASTRTPFDRAADRLRRVSGSSIQTVIQAVFDESRLCGSMWRESEACTRAASSGHGSSSPSFEARNEASLPWTAKREVGTGVGTRAHMHGVPGTSDPNRRAESARLRQPLWAHLV